MNAPGFHVRQEADSIDGSRLVRIGLSAILVAVLAVAVSTALLGRAGQARLGGGPAERVAKYGYTAPATLGLIDQTLVAHENRAALQRLRDESWLESAGWIDPAHGVAHIPIERAMTMIADENRAEANQTGKQGGSP